MAQERDIAHAVMQIAAVQPGNICTFELAYEKIPLFVRLTKDNRKRSTTRRGEPLWHQLVRNIYAHHQTPSNAIANGLLVHVPRVGYRITSQGVRHLIQTAEPRVSPRAPRTPSPRLVVRPPPPVAQQYALEPAL